MGLENMYSAVSMNQLTPLSNTNGLPPLGGTRWPPADKAPLQYNKQRNHQYLVQWNINNISSSWTNVYKGYICNSRIPAQSSSSSSSASPTERASRRGCALYVLLSCLEKKYILKCVSAALIVPLIWTMVRVIHSAHYVHTCYSSTLLYVFFQTMMWFF